MMLVMFAVGVMNVVWMAVLGMVMTIEKMLTGRRFTHSVGVALIVVGVGLRGNGLRGPLAGADELS